jgi:uncharacterized Zn ribbon protein
MEKIFWVECPECHGKFYCNHQDMRHTSIKLFCPSCRTRFSPHEASMLDEREKAASQSFQNAASSGDKERA